LNTTTVGDNSNPFANGWAPIDENPGRSAWDAQRTAANPYDLRGKILRITPQNDGSYTIPPGNLFPDGIGGRPEIYIMGVRNPFRVTYDPETETIYWGDIGPDARQGDPRIAIFVIFFPPFFFKFFLLISFCFLKKKGNLWI
jgi:cytochrome c